MTLAATRIVLRGCRVEAPGASAVEPALDLELRCGGSVVLLGRSGAGKTLLSRLLLGSLPGPPLQVEGAIELAVGDRLQRIELAGRRPGMDLRALVALRGDVVGYVPQGGRESLAPGWPVARILASMGEAGPDEARMARLLERFGLPTGPALKDRVATELSEGMIRRLMLAAGLARQAPLLVVDEPTSGLDPRLRETVADALAELLDEGRGLVVTTHDVALARRVGREFLLVEEGRVAARADEGAEWPDAFAPWRDEEVAT